VEDQAYLNEPPRAQLPFYKKANFLSILIVVTLAYVGFLLYQAVSVNFQTNRKIAELKKEIAEIEGDRESLQALIAYYQTPDFQELEARKKLGLKMPGEKVVTVEVPEASHNQPVESSEDSAVNSGEPNYQKWLDYLSGHYE